MTSGQCLCGTVRFSLEAAPRTFYRCHCSLCRRQTGVGHNLATVVKAADFHWHAGASAISTWQKATGYRNDFCGQCGATVPNPLRGEPYVWVPLGLLDGPLDAECVGDYCTDDAMPWDRQRCASHHAAAPETLDALIQALAISP